MSSEGYVRTFGHQYLAVALCDRCKRKFPLDELWSDPNSPGLKVCRDDIDQLDPYRLTQPSEPAPTLRYARPDTDLTP